MQGGGRVPYIVIKSNTKKGYEKAEHGDSVNFAYPNSKTRRGRVGKQVAQTLTASPPHQGVVMIQSNILKGGGQIPMVENTDTEVEVRRYTPKECFRLMGFDDADVDLLSANGISNTQLYKMAGNSIVVNVLEHLFGQLFDSDNKLFL